MNKTPKKKLTALEYRRLCRRIYNRYKVSLNLPFWEACELADEVYHSVTTEKRTYELLDEAVEEEKELVS